MNEISQIFADMVQTAPPRYRASVLQFIEACEPLSEEDAADLSQFLARLDGFLSQDDQTQALLLAPTGRGKTTLLLHWLAQLATASPWKIIFAPISLRYQTASANATLRALTQALATIHGDREYQQVYNASPDQLRPILASYLRTPPPAGYRLLLVIDGLDETVGWSIGRDLFAYTPGPNVRILATVRYVDSATPKQWLERLGWHREQTSVLLLDHLSEHALDTMVQRILTPFDPERASDDSLRARIRHMSQGDPLTMRLLAEAIHHGRIDADALPHLHPGLEGYVEYCISDWFYRHRDLATALAMFPRLCAIALGPLSTDDLLHLAPDVFEQHSTIQQVAHIIGEFIEGDGSDENGYVFRHLRFREIFRERILDEEERHAIEQRFVRYGLRWYEGQTFTRKRARTMVNVMETEEGLRIPDYVRRYWIAHLSEAGEWARMRRVLTDIVPVNGIIEQPWAAARFAIEGHYVGYLSDLDILWRWAEHQYDLVLGMRCALISSSIRSQSGSLLPELLVGLVMIGTPAGRWSGTLAMKHIQQMPSPGQKVKAMKALAACAPCQIPYGTALDLVRSFVDEGWRSEALASLAPYLTPELQERALRMARAILDEKARSRALTALAPTLPLEQQPAIFSEALESARAIGHEGARARALASLIPLLPSHSLHVLEEAFIAVCWLRLELPRSEAMLALALHPEASAVPDLPQEALGVARNFIRKGQMTEALKVVAIHLPPEHQPDFYTEALNAVVPIAHEGTRALAFHALIPYLPPAQQEFARNESLQAALAIPSPRQRFRVLSVLAPMFSLEQQTEFFLSFLHEVQAIEDTAERVGLLQILAPYLPHEQQTTIYATILEHVPAIEDEKQRATMLVNLAERLAPDNAELCRDALHTIRMITDELERSSLLTALAPHIPPSMFADMLSVVRTIHDGWQRAETLVGLIPFVSREEQPLLYGEALAASRAIGDELLLADCLMTLLPHSPDTRHHDYANHAIQAISGMVEERQRVEALLTIASYCEPHQQLQHYEEALVTAFAMSNPKTRSEVLFLLIPQLPATLLPDVLERARTIPDPWYRFETLRACALQLPSREQLELYREILALAQAITDEWQQSEALRVLAPIVPITLHPDVLAVILAIRHELYRNRALLVFIPHLATPLIPKVFAAVQGMEQEKWKAEALMVLIPYLPIAMISSALEVARSLSDGGNRARVLQVLVVRLPESLKPEGYQETLDAVQATGYIRWKTDVLVGLAPHLPDAFFPQALAIANAMKDRAERARVLLAYSSRIPEVMMGEVVSDICAISDDWERANALIALGPVLPASRIPEVLAAARLLNSPEDRARTLTALSGSVPMSQQHRMYREALAACRAIPSDGACAVALCTLASALPISQQLEIYAEAFGAVRAIAGEEEQLETLTVLVEHLATWTTHSITHVAAATILWQAAIRFFTTPGRPYLLQHLVLLVPWMARLMNRDDIERVVDMLIEIPRCWP